MYRCTFCDRPTPDRWALTRCLGDPENTASWGRYIAPACERCGDMLDAAGERGLVVKATRARWFSGHTHSGARFEMLGAKPHIIGSRAIERD